MKTVRVRQKLESEHLHLPELKPLIGKTVDITVVEHLATKVPFEGENVPAHTPRASTAEEMGQELDKRTQMTSQPSVPLKHKVDYKHVF